MSNLEIFAVSAEVDRDERQPDYTGRIHRERDVLGLVEVLRDMKFSGMVEVKVLRDEVLRDG